MKTFRAFAALAFLLACTPAFAQWQTPNHSVPIGKGSGITGFGSAAPSTAGQPFVSQGASADPAFGTIGNSGFTAGAADTYKGSLNGTTTVDVPRAPCTAASQALRYTAGVGESCGNIVVQTGFDMPVNLGLSVPAPSGGALVVTLTQANGSAPTSTNPVLVPFRSTVLTTGAVVWSTISATQSITIPSGATLGTSSNSGSCANGSTCPFRVWIFEAYNGGTPELGVATCSNPTTIFGCASWESTLKTSVTISSGATAAGTLYATTGVSLDAVRIIGYCDFANGLSTAGTWASSCTTLQLFGPGIKKPGDTVQTQYGTTTTSGTTTSATFVALTNGLTVSITPTSTPNLIKAVAFGTLASGAGAAVTVQMARGATLIGNPYVMNIVPGGAYETPVSLGVLDAPASVSVLSYGFQGKVPSSTGSFPAGSTGLMLQVDEIQG